MAASPTDDKKPVQSAGPSTASLLGGVALVGAAAGYALLAMRFRTFGTSPTNADRFAAGSAEMRAAAAFSKDWAKNAEPAFRDGKTWEEAFAGAGARARESQQQRESEHRRWKQEASTAIGASTPGPPAWALHELGLSNSAGLFALDEAKRAYKQRAKALHPDSGGNDAAFKRLGEAYRLVQEHCSSK